MSIFFGGQPDVFQLKQLPERFLSQKFEIQDFEHSLCWSWFFPSEKNSKAKDSIQLSVFLSFSWFCPWSPDVCARIMQRRTDGALKKTYTCALAQLVSQERRLRILVSVFYLFLDTRWCVPNFWYQKLFFFGKNLGFLISLLLFVQKLYTLRRNKSRWVFLVFFQKKLAKRGRFPWKPTKVFESL